MKRIIGLMIVFSFLFSGTFYALMLPREDSGLVMSTMKIVNEPVVFLASVDPDPTWPAWLKWLEELRKEFEKLRQANPSAVSWLRSLTDTEAQRIWDGIFNLAIKQFNSKVNPAGREGVKNGDYSGDAETKAFAETLIAIFLKPDDDPAAVREENIGPKTGVDEDHFIFEFVREQLHLYLVKDIGRLNGLPWGVWKIVRQPRVSGSGDKYELVFREDNERVELYKNDQSTPIRVFYKPKP